ncbi:unnamed protein product [Tilletia laevis]|nr:unnamed protein product [Tilletia laevis]
MYFSARPPVASPVSSTTSLSPLSPSGSSASTASVSTTTTLTSRGRSLTPLYNLNVHNILPTTVNDANTEARVAKFGRKTLDIDGLGSIEARPLFQGLNDLDTLQRQLELTVGIRTGLEPAQHQPQLSQSKASSSGLFSSTLNLGSSSAHGRIQEEDDDDEGTQSQPPTSFQAMTPEAQAHSDPAPPAAEDPTPTPRIAFPSLSPRLQVSNTPSSPAGSPIAALGNKLVNRFKRFSIGSTAAAERSVSPARSLADDPSSLSSKRPRSVAAPTPDSTLEADTAGSDHLHANATTTASDKSRSVSPASSSQDRSRRNSANPPGRAVSLSAASQTSAAPFSLIGLTAPSMLSSTSAISTSSTQQHTGEVVSALVPAPPRLLGERRLDGYYWTVRKWTPRTAAGPQSPPVNSAAGAGGIGSKFSLRRRVSEEGLGLIGPSSSPNAGPSKPLNMATSPLDGARRSMSLVRRSLQISQTEADSIKGGGPSSDSLSLSPSRGAGATSPRMSISSGFSGIGAKLLSAAKVGANAAATTTSSLSLGPQQQQHVSTAPGSNPVLTAVWNKFHLHNRLVLIEQGGIISREREQEREAGNGHVYLRSPSITPSTLLQVGSETSSVRRESATSSVAGTDKTASFTSSPSASSAALSSNPMHEPSHHGTVTTSVMAGLIPHPPAETIEVRFEWTRESRVSKARKQREDALVGAAKARVRAAAAAAVERRRSRRAGAASESAAFDGGLAPSPRSQPIGLPPAQPQPQDAEPPCTPAAKSVGSKLVAACGGLASWSFGGGDVSSGAGTGEQRPRLRQSSVPSVGMGGKDLMEDAGVRVTPASPLVPQSPPPVKGTGTAAPSVFPSCCFGGPLNSVAAAAAANILSHIPTSAAEFWKVSAGLALPATTIAAPLGSVPCSRAASAGGLTIAPLGDRTPTMERGDLIDSYHARRPSMGGEARVGAGGVRPGSMFLDATGVVGAADGGSRRTSYAGTSSTAGGESGISSDSQLLSHSDPVGQGRRSPSAVVEARQAAVDKLEGAGMGSGAMRRLNSRSEGARTISNHRSRWGSEMTGITDIDAPTMAGKPGLDERGGDEDEEEELSDQEDSERPWMCHLVLSPSVRIPLGTLAPAPYHPKIVAQLAIPAPLPDLRQSGLGPGARGISREELKDVVSVTAMHLVVREGFGGIGKVPGAGGRPQTASSFIPPGATGLTSLGAGSGAARSSPSLDLPASSSPAAMIAAQSSMTAAASHARRPGWRLSMGAPNSNANAETTEAYTRIGLDSGLL